MKPDHVNDTHPSSGVGAPILISKSETHVLIALEIATTELARHWRLLENLLILANRGDDRG